MKTTYIAVAVLAILAWQGRKKVAAKTQLQSTIESNQSGSDVFGNAWLQLHGFNLGNNGTPSWVDSAEFRQSFVGTVSRVLPDGTITF